MKKKFSEPRRGNFERRPPQKPQPRPAENTAATFGVSPVLEMLRANARRIEVVVMVVRQKHHVERRQLLERTRRRMKALRAGETNGGRALTEHRIREDTEAVELEEDGAVTEPCDAQSA